MLITREMREQREREMLAPYAMRSSASRGREYPEPEHPYRTVFQRDRDRIIHCNAWRRLQYKTQVFIYYEGDYYRTRLTHTIEATQIALTAAEALGLNPRLTETIARAHDLGHSPFGHAGEEALDKLMLERSSDSFEGNWEPTRREEWIRRNRGKGFNHTFQTLRVVEELEERYPTVPGLNLAWETREGILKHETVYDKTPEDIPAKWLKFEVDKRPTLEAQVVNLADVIAYSTHDLDDGLRSEILEPAYPKLREIALWNEALAGIGETAKTIPGRLPSGTRYAITRYLINALVTDVIKATADRLDHYSPQSAEAVRCLPENLVKPSAEMAIKFDQLKAFLYENLYTQYRVQRMYRKAERVITDLFETLERDPGQLPTERRERVERCGDQSRVICDYIAGMTDRYALLEWKRLFDPFEPA